MVVVPGFSAQAISSRLLKKVYSYQFLYFFFHVFTFSFGATHGGGVDVWAVGGTFHAQSPFLAVLSYLVVTSDGVVVGGELRIGTLPGNVPFKFLLVYLHGYSLLKKSFNQYVQFHVNRLKR